MARRREAQLELKPRTWGGRREGAGRPRIRDVGGAHRSRPVLNARTPVLVTMRMCKGVPFLRDRRCLRALDAALRASSCRFRTGITHFSIQGNHIHLIIESSDERAMARAMKGLSVRVAQAINRVRKRQGQVVAERYHTRYLRSPRQVRHAVSYVLENHTKHLGLRGIDPYASLAHPELVMAPRTWLLQRHGMP